MDLYRICSMDLYGRYAVASQGNQLPKCEKCSSWTESGNWTNGIMKASLGNTSLSFLLQNNDKIRRRQIFYSSTSNLTNIRNQVEISIQGR